MIAMIETILAYLSTILETEPEPEVLILPKHEYEVLEFSNVYILEFNNGHTKTFEKKDWYIEFKRDRILLYSICYFCKIDKKYIKTEDLYKTNQGYALNTHVVKKTQHTSFSLNPVYFIDFNLEDSCYRYKDTYNYFFCFVFNVLDMRKIYAKTANKLVESLPLEMVMHIMTFLNCKKRGNGLYKVTDFPFDFSQEFKGEIPELLSKLQLKKLYEIGAIKLAYKSGLYSMIELSDESYDHIYPNSAPNILQKTFRSKEEMQRIKNNFLHNFFI
jgi:hypothetical protein